jgi:hypothetical protein
MYRVIVIAVLGLLCIPATAQDKFEVFGGYEYLHNGNVTVDGVTQQGSSQGYNGWNAAATYKLNRLIGVEGDFSGTYATNSGVNLHVYTYTGGPVVSIPAPIIRPFVHALFGGMQLTGSADGVSTTFNGFTTMFGGGVDAKVNHFLAIRLGQVDWLYYHFGSKTIAGTPFPAFSGSNNVRFSTGVVLRF